jgi:hypothetical protein
MSRKRLDPGARFSWTCPTDPEIVIEYKALAGPTIERNVPAYILRRCITAVNGYGEPWRADTDAPVEWAEVLHTDVANAVYLAIWAVSHVEEDERRDSLSPHGSPSQDGITPAPIAVGNGSADGSVSCGMTTPTPDGNE